MRIVSLKEFMTLPPGTIFEQYDVGGTDAGAVMIKNSVGTIQADTGSCDWDETQLAGSINLLGDEFPCGMGGFDHLERSPLHSVPMYVDVCGRNGLYPHVDDTSIKFVIYEQGDVLKMIASLINAAVLTGAPVEAPTLRKDEDESLGAVSLSDTLAALVQLIPTLKKP